MLSRGARAWVGLVGVLLLLGTPGPASVSARGGADGIAAARTASGAAGPERAAAGPGSAATEAGRAAVGSERAAVAGAQGPVRVRLSGQRLAVEVPVWLAEERGYFRQEGIEIEPVTFGSASEMIPALATGQLDAAPMPANPAMWNAVARGVGAKVVLDLGTYRPGDSDQALMVRTAVYDAGRGHRLEDLRSLSLAITPPGKATTTACALSVGLRQAGLPLDDVDIQPITFPDM